MFMWPNATIGVMGPDQLSSVMQTVSGKKDTKDANVSPDERFKELRAKIENQTSAVYSTARLWVSSSPPRPRDHELVADRLPG